MHTHNTNNFNHSGVTNIRYSIKIYSDPTILLCWHIFTRYKENISLEEIYSSFELLQEFENYIYDNQIIQKIALTQEKMRQKGYEYHLDNVIKDLMNLSIFFDNFDTFKHIKNINIRDLTGISNWALEMAKTRKKLFNNFQSLETTYSIFGVCMKVYKQGNLDISSENNSIDYENDINTFLYYLDAAYNLAKFSYAGKKRFSIDDYGKYPRIFDHLEETSKILVNELGITNGDAIIIALFHDLFEDIGDLYDDIANNFSKYIADSIQKLSKPNLDEYKKSYGFKDYDAKFQRDKDYFSSLFEIKDLLKAIKLADRIHNLRTLISRGTSNDFIERKYKETEYYFLDLASQISDDAYNLIQVELDTIRSYLEADIKK